MMRPLAALELLTAAGLWGFGFVATVWAMKELNPFALTFLRFAIASLFLLPLLLFPRHRRAVFENFRLAFWPAIFFAGTLVIQTWGLLYTTPTKSGFITTLYVVFIPFLESFHMRRRLPAALWACVVFAFLGTAMIVNVGVGEINFGDVLTLICALLATAQIYLIGIVSPRVKSPFTFNLVQSFWAMLVCLPFAFDRATWHSLAAFPSWPREAQVGLLSLAFGSTMIAFALQVRAQRRLSPTVSSLLFLMESPFAMLFSILLLSQTLGPLEAAGALVIFASALAASLVEARRKDS